MAGLEKEVGRLTAIQKSDSVADEERLEELRRMEKEIGRLREDVRRLTGQTSEGDEPVEDPVPGGGPGEGGGVTRGWEDEGPDEEKLAIGIEEGEDWDENGPMHGSGTAAADGAPDGMEGFDGATAEGGDERGGDGADPGATDPGPDLRRFLFSDSACLWLFMDEVDGGEFGTQKILPRDRYFAVYVIVLQLGSYVVLGMLMYNNIETGIQDLGRPTLEISADHCYDASLHDRKSFWDAMCMDEVHGNLATANVTAEDFPGLLSCSNHFESIGEAGKNDGVTIAGIIMASYMLTCFIWPDVLGAGALFTCPGRWSKAAAVIILFEATAAFSVGMMAILVRYAGGPLETFLLIVGIVFIHDLDEKAAAAGRTMCMLYQVYGQRLVDSWIGRIFWFFFAPFSLGNPYSFMGPIN